MSLTVVLGKGPVGSALSRALLARGHEVRVLSRSGGRSVSGVEHRAVDAADCSALTDATRGATALFNCANPPYHRWELEWPPIAAALLQAAERTGAVLVTMGNLYGYGPVSGPMTESTPLRPGGRKGQVRVRMWEQALARHKAGAVRVTEARASDFVGPEVLQGGHLGERVLPRVLAGKTVRVLGDPDQPHSWTSVLDVGEALALLAEDERAWGQAWHVPTAPPLTLRHAVEGLCRAAGVREVAVRPLPHLALRAGGVVSPLLRELEEMRHSFTAPYELDSSSFTRTFGVAATPLEQTWQQTVTWWRDRAATAD